MPKPRMSDIPTTPITRMTVLKMSFRMVGSVKTFL